MRLSKHSVAPALFVAITFLAVGSASGMTALQKAVHKGDIKKVQELLDKGADINEWNYGTALVFAASENKLDIAKLLIERGADMNALGKNGWTALGCAAQGSYGDMVDLLIAKGADIDRAIEGLKTTAAWSRSMGVNNDAKISQGMGLIRSRMGMAFYSSGQYEKAARAFQTQAQANPQDPNNFIGLTFSFNALKKYDEGKAAAENAVKLAPDNSDARVGLADALMGKGDFAQAVEPLKKAAEINPKNPWIFTRLGNASYNLGNYPEAVANFRKASELAPDEPGPIQSIMNTSARMGNLDDAIAAAGRLLAKKDFKGVAETLGLRSFFYREKGLPDEAAKDAAQAAAADAANEWALIALGAVALDRGNHDEAILKLSAVKDNNFALAPLLLAAAHARKGNLPEAEKVFAEAGEGTLSSKNTLVARNARIVADLLKPVLQAHLDKAKSLEAGPGARDALGEYALALKIADDAGARDIVARAAALLKAHPDFMELPEEARKYSLRGEVLIKEKDFDQALNEYTAALRIAPFCPVLHYNAALIAADGGRFSQAVAHMNTYLQLQPGAQNAREAKDLVYKWEFMIERGTDRK
jgi:tetratricopeptide (TPR) repeat protein